jgi:dipeptidyl aminopeptidase/acylaminoacyl peptidase
MRSYLRALLVFLFTVTACSRPNDAGAAAIAHPDSPAGRIEYFVRKPQGQGPWPAVVLLHGHQNFWANEGGRAFVDYGVMDELAGKGYLAVSISLPGYGNSSGPADFAGPFTQHAVSAVIAQLKSDGFAQHGNFAIEGISLGALTAALVASQETTVAGLVLISGLYDLPQFLAHPQSVAAALIKLSAWQQTDGSEDALHARSALFVAEEIKAATLILNGAQDDRTDPGQARQMADAINAHGGNARARIYPEHGHQIPFAVRKQEVDEFIDRILKSGNVR